MADAESSESANHPQAEEPSGYRRAAAKVREFPTAPGVYLMKDAAGRVIYVGKAKNLRSRAGSYFQKAAEEGLCTLQDLRDELNVATCCGRCATCAKNLLSEAHSKSSAA